MGRILEQIDKDLVIQEALYGFVMALTFTTATQLGIYDMPRTTLILAIVAMDSVWGTIDLIIFFNIDVIAQRRRRHELERVLRDKPADSAETADGFLEGTVFDDLDAESRHKAVELILASEMQDNSSIRNSSHRYLFNAVTAFITTISTAVPAALCLMFIDDIWLACLMAALASCVALLFIGYKMAISDRKIIRFFFGLMMCGLTMVLTFFAATLGG